MSGLGLEVDDAVRERIDQALLLAFGGLLFGAADYVAGWLVGLFSATLPLPANTHLAATTLLFLGLVYGVALHTEPDGEATLLEQLTGGIE